MSQLTPQAEMQSDDPGIGAPQASKESESKSEPTPLAELQSDAPGMPHGRERVWLAISKVIVKATPAHQAKQRSLASDTAAVRFKVRQGGASTAHDVSTYITHAMFEAQKKGGSIVKYFGSKDTTNEDNQAKQVEMVMVLRADAALEAIAHKICMAASAIETKGSLKLCNLTVPARPYRDIAEFVEYLDKICTQAAFTSDIEF